MIRTWLKDRTRWQIGALIYLVLWIPAIALIVFKDDTTLAVILMIVFFSFVAIGGALGQKGSRERYKANADDDFAHSLEERWIEPDKFRGEPPDLSSYKSRRAHYNDTEHLAGESWAKEHLGRKNH